ncbi:MAG: sodium:proton exchanger [Candidatus Nephthysia bennettiae]|uniref:Cation:proton antiporter n=1 Tax=Candidatus Nephthysia bennettiae TaxID=3127016 RepID=A0A934N8D0_9BACT|nr:cation:proton antiporter [Candidatus Dormibacteraeota bacterium]MBJ7610820.1 cation:proton antiporter [Candidatus Dormibacteraeota bacterium]PZR84854.1 MAG: sodium:proton exchanger [Candidatus Dormibacteraeota bacterium]
MIEARVETFVLLLMAACAVALVVKAVPVPYVSALALVGLLAGLVVGRGQLQLTHSLILFVLLPGLLFEAAFNLSWRDLRANLVAVVALATLGVVLTTAVIAVVGHAALGLALPVAILLGTMISPTDPVAVVAVFRRLGVPARLVNLVESESLLNDGTGVVLFTVALAATQASPAGVGSLAWDFARLIAGGIGLGLGVGLLLSFVTSRIDDFPVEITLTGIGAYGSYLLAESLHLSGILAVVAAGLVLGNLGRPRAMSARTQEAVTLFWDYVAFLLNSVVFLLVGLDVPWSEVRSLLPGIVVAALIALLARAVAVYAVLGLLHPLPWRVSFRWQHLIVWSGLRGAIAVALALSLTETNPQFSSVRALVYGVVLLSILLQGSTIGPLARLLLRDAAEIPKPA